MRYVSKDEATALFVSPAGSDVLGEGSRTKPFKTLAAGLAKLSPNRRRVYVCEGRYEEDLDLTAQHAALVLSGGVDCNWTPNGAKPVIGTLTSPSALSLAQVEAPVVLESIELRAGEFRGSSIVARTHGDIVFRNVYLVASKGADGAKGETGESLRYSASIPLSGAGWVVFCKDGTSSHGGDAPGGSGTPSGTENGGVSSSACNAGGDGSQGEAGAQGDVAPAIANVGELSEGGFIPRSGEVGRAGKPGQGGGAGAGANATGGGAGGCGASGGAGGLGGGASIDILSYNAKVTIVTSVMETGGGGRGGDGGEGGAGDPGGTASPPATGACTGGSGGMGGNGGAGGGGAGGLSVGVLYAGTEPTVDDFSRTSARLGPAGTAGAPSGMSGVYEVAFGL